MNARFILGCLTGFTAALLYAGCGGGDDRSDVWGDGGPGTGDDGADGATSDDGGEDGGDDGEDGSDGGDDGGGDGPKLDVGSDDGPPTLCDPDVEDCGCTAVDILFIIDNSGSMFIHQQRLAEVFPRFVDVMIDALPAGTDLHVGITTQGGFWKGAGSGSWSSGCVSDASPYPGGYMPPTEGANGSNGDQGRLYEHEGRRYFEINTSDDPQPLKDWFSTAATLPAADSPQQDQVELLAAAGAYPFHPANDATNAGFLRDEGAVLLIFYLTDTSDITPEDADSLANIVRDAKAGCGGDDCILTGGMVSPTAHCLAEYPRLDEFLNAFGKPPVALGNIDGPGGGWPPAAAPIEDYEAVLGDALANVVSQTCDEIPPPAG